MLTDNDLPYMYNAGSLVNGAKHERSLVNGAKHEKGGNESRPFSFSVPPKLEAPECLYVPESMLFQRHGSFE
jgi:hypothetical protein